MTDLDKLIEAVEAGGDGFIASDGWIEAWDAVAPSLQTYRMKSDGGSAALSAYAAHHGSLDAAHRLHEALLPGWAWKRTVHFGPVASVGVWEPPKFVMGQTAKEVDGNTARSWLLAILRALKAQGGDK